MSKIWVTGGHGFLGKRVISRLEELGYTDIVNPTHSECDLKVMAEVEEVFHAHSPDMIVHLAALVGGIGANRSRPGEFFYDNMLMGLNVIEASRKAGIKKFLCAGTVCAYPKFCPVPFKEDDLWKGYPEETNAPYGVAKKALLVQLQAYRAQYGFPGIFIIPVNLFGPHDNFDPESSHVIPAMIRKFVEADAAGAATVKLWGTGEASREFLYVDDAAVGICSALEQYDSPEPVNLGTGREISIKRLAELISDIVGYSGDIMWDPTMPNGQPRRQLDTGRAKDSFGWEAEVSLEAGLRRTVEWYTNTLTV